MKSFLLLFLLGALTSLADAQGPEGDGVESSDKNLQLNDGDETDLGNDEIKQDSSEDKNQEDSENPMSNSEDQDDDSENADEDALTTVKGNDANAKPFWWRRRRRSWTVYHRRRYSCSHRRRTRLRSYCCGYARRRRYACCYYGRRRYTMRRGYGCHRRRYSQKK